MSPKSRPPNCCGDPKLRDIRLDLHPGHKLTKMFLSRIFRVKLELFPVKLNTKNLNFKRFYGAEDLKKNLKDESVMILEGNKTICLSVSGCTRTGKTDEFRSITYVKDDSILKFGVENESDFRIENSSISFHGRRLPDHLISLESKEGQEIFHESFKSGNATNFFSLITNFASQSDVSMCGPASLAMVMNALKLDPKRTWRRPWRWWSDEMFACCAGSLKVMKSSGVTLEFFDRIARKQLGISVQTMIPGELKEFETVLMKCATEQDYHVIVSFGRKLLGQTGIGHFSPIAAIHPEKNLALVLDVARFKYPPYWVKIKDLHSAMKDIDPETGVERGYSIVTKV